MIKTTYQIMMLTKLQSMMILFKMKKINQTQMMMERTLTITSISKHFFKIFNFLFQSDYEKRPELDRYEDEGIDDADQ